MESMPRTVFHKAKTWLSNSDCYEVSATLKYINDA